MIDLATLFKDGPPERGSFLSRIFGIFNEEVIRIWARDGRSPYNIHERRPTLHEGSRRYTLDFLFEKCGALFVSEMKCEIQYQNYRYWRLDDPEQLKHHCTKRAFELFLELSRDARSVSVKAGGEPVEVVGTVLVWGAATARGVLAVRDHSGISDVLTVEGCIRDLLEWDNPEYLRLLSEREQWISSMFTGLRTR
jgi:hypothetical protein